MVLQVKCGLAVRTRCVVESRALERVQWDAEFASLAVCVCVDSLVRDTLNTS